MEKTTPHTRTSQTFQVSLSPIEAVDIAIEVMPLRAENLSLTPWVSTYILANKLHTLDIPSPSESDPSTGSDIPILELGAGVGLVALTAALLFRSRAIISDLDPIVPGLQHIADTNKSLLSSRDASAIAGTLDWSKPNVLTLYDGATYSAENTKARILLAADTIYDEDHPALLASTVLKWLSKDRDARFVSCQALRVAYLDYIREFWELLEEGGLECIREGREEADGEWDDEKVIEWSVWRWKV